MLPDQKSDDCDSASSAARSFTTSGTGIQLERILTDNVSAYVSAAHAVACHALGVRHTRTRPYRPQTNGKAERFIRTLTSHLPHGAI